MRRIAYGNSLFYFYIICFIFLSILNDRRSAIDRKYMYISFVFIFYIHRETFFKPSTKPSTQPSKKKTKQNNQNILNLILGKMIIILSESSSGSYKSRILSKSFPTRTKLIEKYREKLGNGCLRSAKKSYDRIPREVLRGVLKKKRGFQWCT